MPSYFQRQLCFSDQNGLVQQTDEDGILSRSGPKVVLGEPGMGKSEFMRELGRRLDVIPVTAVRFMSSKDPAKLVVSGKPLLIDGLDEAMARREGDAVDTILAQLEAAGSPNFIISCRAREWQQRTVTNLRQIYGDEPTIFTLEPLGRDEAVQFLRQRFSKADTDHVLGHLDEHRLSDLYRNPLTLSLMGQVAEREELLPATRAALFERVCELIWSEHDQDRQDGILGQINEAQVLSAAGAMMAGLLFSGAEALSVNSPIKLQAGELRLANFNAMPGAEAAKAAFSSKLFYSTGLGCAKPIHRVIAEFLGARWLAQQAMTSRARRRLLSQFHGSGGVPASLRGLHAWLAYHSQEMAMQVIAADPFGVLRYGEISKLSIAQADCLFDSLRSLADVDPYFRGQDWDSHTAAGLMIPALRDKIEMIVSSEASNAQLRMLLIEGLKDTALCVDLEPTLERILFSGNRFYRERHDAAQALWTQRDGGWWENAVATLCDEGSEDATRLAHGLIERLNCNVGDELLVRTLFAEFGVLISPLPKPAASRPHRIRSYKRIIERLSADRLVSVLDILSDFAPLIGAADWESKNDLVDFVSGLIVRAIDENVVGVSDAASLWRWLAMLQSPSRAARKYEANLAARLHASDELRQAIQNYAIFDVRPRPTVWMSEVDLGQRMVGLSGRPEDVARLLERFTEFDNNDPQLRDDWCDLMRLGCVNGRIDLHLREVSKGFQRGDPDLEEFIRKLEDPTEPPWMIEQERATARRKVERKNAYERDRRAFESNREAIRAGDFGAIYPIVRAYLGFFSDLSREKLPEERIVEWLGDGVRDDAIVGFEAALHRSDVPSPGDVAQAFADGQFYYSFFALMAGLLARQYSGIGFADLAPELLKIGLLLCYSDRLFIDDGDENSRLQDALEELVFQSDKDRADFGRMWIEPSLLKGIPHVGGLYRVAHDESWQRVGATLAAGWLTKFPDVPENIEVELIDCVTHSSAIVALEPIAAARASAVFRTFEQMLVWLAVDVLVRFDLVVPDLAGIGVRNPEFIWYLRNRLVLERHGRLLSLSARQIRWIVSEFRSAWPYAEMPGRAGGDSNTHDAAEFLIGLINLLADDISEEAIEAMRSLISEPMDGYSDHILHMAAEQRQKHVEENFSPLSPEELAKVIADGPPSNIDDLRSLVLEELAVAQKKLIGDDKDQVSVFWNDAGVPYDENRCRDRLAMMIEPELVRYDVWPITEADMPNTKRADLAFMCKRLQLPVEVKGQWHLKVWDAATDQLDAQYMIDWRSEERGIYLVLWFGDLPPSSGRRLKVPPDGLASPNSPEEMRRMLVERIPEARRSLIDVVVLDLSAGKSS